MPSPDRRSRLAGGLALGGLLAAGLLAAGLAAAQALADTAKPAFGQPATEAEIAAWDIDIQTPTGKGLPAGSGTAAQGLQVYNDKCAHCHGENASGGPFFGTMVGGIGSFTTEKRVLTPGSMYPYAPILFDYIRRSMPMDHPQSLTADEIYAVSAYLLQLNGLVGEAEVIDAQSMPKIQMPNRDGFLVDDRPDTDAVRCMDACKPL